MKLRAATQRLRRLLVRSFGRRGSSPTATPTEILPPAARFDARWYPEAYPEARAEVEAGRFPATEAYYHKVGAAAGHNPNPFFSESWYRERYSDVAEALTAGHFASGFAHFVAFGCRDGRRPNGLLIDHDWYRARYPEAAADLAADRFPDAYAHYLERGAAAGHDPHAAFSESHYRQRYPEVSEQVATRRFISGYQHFMNAGLAEGRQPHPLYDETHYLHLHPDVETEIAQGRLAHGYLHLITLGLAEGRKWQTEDHQTRLRAAATSLAHSRLDELLTSDRTLIFDTSVSPVVSVLLVLYGRAELTLACLESLARVQDPDFELIVIDNASSDRTSRLLKRLRGAVVVRNDENVGFTRAANQAAGQARGEVLLFLNNDAEVLPSSIRAAVDRLAASPDSATPDSAAPDSATPDSATPDSATPDVGAVGGRVLGIDGKLQEAGAIVWRDGTTGGYGHGESATDGAYLFPREVDYCSGVFLLTPRATFEQLGGFDLAFAPAYYEESDYCFRLRAAGRRVFYEPRAVVLHHGSASLPDATHLSRMLADHRSVFADRHAEALAEAYPAAPIHLFVASDRRKFRGRVLVLDDHVPLESLGGGSPRAQEILHSLCELGYFVTFFATNPTRLDVWVALEELPEPSLELVHHLGRPKFADFWQLRQGTYDLMIVSRRHNFQCLLDDGFDPGSESVRLIYDAESLAGRRRERQLEILGAEAPAESDVGVEEEIALARRASEIWAVSEAEARLLGTPDRPARVVAHGERGQPGERSFDDRGGILFVGRLDEEWNPNVDGLRWYLEDIHPRIVERLGEIPMTIVGEPGDIDLPHPPGVEFLGRVAELAPLYNRHRLFVAPTRFAAGIPKKITGAAAHGLPVVATSILVDQLGWSDGDELLDGGDNDPSRFAERVVALYGSAELWVRLREAAVRRVLKEHGRKALQRAITEALGAEERTQHP